MDLNCDINAETIEQRLLSYRGRSYKSLLISSSLAALAAFLIFYLSLVQTSAPVSDQDKESIDRAIAILDEKGFDTEAFLLRNTATYRSTDHWFNGMIFKEQAYAATNFPFQIVTVYPDFYEKAIDDTERAMILLHEAKHLQGEDEPAAYAYVWKNRYRIGWSQLSHGTSPTYITIAEETRSIAPEIFSCPENPWNDCTELTLTQFLKR